MFHRIILAVDLADPASHPKGLDQALELATQSGGDLRLVNVQPLLPATFMEYVPSDFDEEQEKRAKDARFADRAVNGHRVADAVADAGRADFGEGAESWIGSIHRR